MQAFISFCGKPENTDILRAWIKQEIVREKIDVERLPFVTRDELEQNIDVILEWVKSGESPILIQDREKAVALLFGWGGTIGDGSQHCIRRRKLRKSRRHV